jgi:UDP-glucuronate 4-epimerase
MDLIGLIERAVGRPAEKRFLPMQPGDVVETWAEVADLEAVTGFRPAVPLAEGIDRFVGWYRRWRGNA